MARRPLQASTTPRPTSPVRVVPLSQWPFPDTGPAASQSAGRLTMDGIVVERASRNEYVDAPSVVSDAPSGIRRRPVTRKSPAPSPAPSPGDAVAGSPSRRRAGLAVKVRRLLTCVGGGGASSSTSADDGDRAAAAATATPRCGHGLACRRCGRCRWADCAPAEQTATLRRARSVVDVLSCMCCVRSLFYHCLRDDAGDELDCSDEPCACTGQRHCAARWSVMAALVPCLPCLCLYLPLRCGVDAVCRHPSMGSARPCRCSSRAGSRHPGLKGLLESESSST